MLLDPSKSSRNDLRQNRWQKSGFGVSLVYVPNSICIFILFITSVRLLVGPRKLCRLELMDHPLLCHFNLDSSVVVPIVRNSGAR